MPRHEAARKERIVRDDEFAALPAVLVELDGERRIARVTRLAARLLGQASAHLVGTPFAALAAAPERDALDARLRGIARGHRPTTTFAATLVHADGREMPVRLAGAPGSRPDGPVVVIGIAEEPRDDGFRELVQGAPTAIVSTDADGVVVFVNAAAERLYGWRPDDLIGRPVEVLVPERLRRRHRALRDALSATPASGPVAHGEVLWALRADGTEVPVEVALATTYTADGVRHHTSAVDVSARVRSEAELERRARQQAAIARLGERALEGAETGELMDLAADLVAAGLGLRHVVVLERGQWRRDVVVRSTTGWDAAVLEEARRDGHEPLADATLEADEPLVVRDLAAKPDAVPGGRRLAALGVRAIVSVPIGGRGSGYGVLTAHASRPRTFTLDELHFLRGVTNVLADALRRREAEERMRHQALHDPLTGLANRTLLLDRVRHWERSAERGSRGLAAVLFMDLDDFKLVNDSLGHEAGDELLRQVAERLRHAVRPGDTVARFGGDEFVVFLEDLEHRDDVLHVVTRIQRAFGEPFVPAASQHHVTPSIGIALSDDGADAEALVRNADAALYRAKARGRARYELFDRSLHRQLIRRLRLAADLRRAVGRGDIAVHFEPVVGLATGRVAGFEALARWWREDERVGPGEFIPIAEETGLVVELGAAVLLRAAEQAAAWVRRVGPRAMPYGVSVNLSPRQVAEPGVVEMVRDVLETSGLAPELLALEITETALMTDVEGALATFQRLRGLGVRIILDDFGTGYSSLSHLKRFPIDTVKVDKLFVEGVAHDQGSRAIVAAVLSMAQGFGAYVVAEGVETDEQRRQVTSVGCRYGQGHFFARDLTGGEAEVLLVAQRRIADAGGQFSLPSRSHR